MHNCWIRNRNLVHTFRSHYHYAVSVNTSVLQMSVIRVIFKRPRSLLVPSYITWRLVSDIRRGTRRAACAGYDIAGPGIHLEV